MIDYLWIPAEIIWNFHLNPTIETEYCFEGKVRFKNDFQIFAGYSAKTYF